MIPIFFTICLLILIVAIKNRQYIAGITRTIHRSVSAADKDAWRKRGLTLWRIGVISYGVWLLSNFWRVLIFPGKQITLTWLTSIFFRPPIVQVVLLLSFAWLIIALIKVPAMRIKGINTPFINFEMHKAVEEVEKQGNEDLETAREIEEIRLAAIKIAIKVNPFRDIVVNKYEADDIELLSTAMGGIIFEAFMEAKEIEFFSGIVPVDSEGQLHHDVGLLLPETQYVVRNAHRNGNYWFSGTHLALPISIKDTKAIFYLYNFTIPLEKTDCRLAEIIWDILRGNAGILE